MSNINNTSMLNFNSQPSEVRPEKVKIDASTQTNVTANSGSKRSRMEPTQVQLEQALEVINQAAIIEQRSLSFTIDELSGRSVIKVVDLQTEQLIRQIPSEELLKVAQEIKKLQEEMGQSLGLLIDRQV